jgi:hypothetical protein
MRQTTSFNEVGQCGTFQYFSVLFSTFQYFSVLFSTFQYFSELFSTFQKIDKFVTKKCRFGGSKWENRRCPKSQQVQSVEHRSCLQISWSRRHNVQLLRDVGGARVGPAGLLWLNKAAPSPRFIYSKVWPLLSFVDLRQIFWFRALWNTYAVLTIVDICGL